VTCSWRGGAGAGTLLGVDLFSCRDARLDGLSRADVRRTLRAAGWQRVSRGVYLSGAPTPLLVARAALAAVPGGVVSGELAAALHDMGLRWPVQPEVTVVRERHLRSAGLRVRRRDLRPSEITTIGNVPVTSRARTAADLLCAGDRVAGVWAAERALQRGVPAAQIEQLLAGSSRGVRAARERWPLVEPRSESPLETAVRLEIHDAGLPAPEPQAEIWDDFGQRIARVDLYYPRQRVAIEADGRRPHDQPSAVYRDRRRQNELQHAGVTVLRFTWSDLRLVGQEVGRALGRT
jgi:hypothetical protein